MGSADEEMGWKLPAFPVMKSFTIYNRKTKKVGFEFERGPVSGSFGRIDYKLCFPVLEILCVHSYDVSTVDAFIQPEGGACSAVKSVRKVCINLWWYTRTNQLARLCERFLHVFPNARILGSNH